MSAVKFVLDTDIDKHAAAGQGRPSSRGPPELTYHLSLVKTLSKCFCSVIHRFRPECRGMRDGFTLRGDHTCVFLPWRKDIIIGI